MCLRPFEYDFLSVSFTSSDPSTYIRRRPLILLIVHGTNAVPLFESACPTQFDKCYFAKRRHLDAQHASELHYTVQLRQYHWRVDPDAFMELALDLIPPSARADHGVFDVSDWNTHDFWQVSTQRVDHRAACSALPSTTASEGEDTDAMTTPAAAPSTPLKRKRDSALDAMSVSQFNLNSIYSPVRPPVMRRGAWRRVYVQEQDSPPLGP